jgi:predicted permease
MSRTFMASLRSISTAVIMASLGFYLHRTDGIGPEGKRTLAVLSQRVTIPFFLFTKIIYCKQDQSDDPCPDVTQSLADVWMLLLWPIYVVGIGCIVGSVVAKFTNTPRNHASTVLAACAFGNASALPITLLNVIHSSAPPTSDFGRTDPTLLLSVFMLLYPALLWGLGGWLLDHNSKISALATTNAIDDDNTQTIEMSYVSDSHRNRHGLPLPPSCSANGCLDRSEQ